jgi:hypothetical protein
VIRRWEKQRNITRDDECPPVQTWLKPRLGKFAQKLYDEHLWRIYRIVFAGNAIEFFLQAQITKCRAVLHVPFNGGATFFSECCIEVIETGFCGGISHA